MQGGQVRADHIATLMRSKKALPKLRDFVYGGDTTSTVYAQLRYAQAWALVHFLRKGPPGRTPRASTSCGASCAPAKSHARRAGRGVRGVDWDKLERDFWQHLASLK
jgi:hypothetical protein